jgi:hypothetical protein
MAAQELEATDSPSLTRVSFFPQQKKNALTLTAPVMRRVSAATSRPAEFRFVPRPPFAVAPYQRGWRLIGRAYAWMVADAVKEGDYERAVSTAVAATRFGFDLAGGSAVDASLGLSIADDVRKALAPAMSRMQSSQLRALSEGMKGALQRKPPMRKVAENEYQNMLQAVQYVRDSAASGRMEALATELGLDGGEATEYLRGIRDDNEKLATYFQGFATEAQAQAQHFTKLSEMSAKARKETPKLELARTRPWRRFARHFFQTMGPLLEIDDATVARTRLMILEAELLRRSKLQKSVPRSLEGATPALVTDPYSGDPFIYHGGGTDFDLYSVGSDFLDNGGETDESFTTPDLKLERPEG